MRRDPPLQLLQPKVVPIPVLATKKVVPQDTIWLQKVVPQGGHILA